MHQYRSTNHADFEQYNNSNIFYSDQEQNDKTNDNTYEKDNVELQKTVKQIKNSNEQYNSKQKQYLSKFQDRLNKVPYKRSYIKLSIKQSDQQQLKRSQQNSEYSDNNYAKSTFSNEPSHKSSNSQKSQNKNNKSTCQKCGNQYTSYSSLRAHIRSKHPDWYECMAVRPHPHTKSKMVSVQCQQCGMSFPSKTSLYIHIANKHKTKRQRYSSKLQQGSSNIQQLGLEMEGGQSQQKCGCGCVYSSRSALNLHVRRKHGGIYPPGSTEKVYRKRGQPSREQMLFQKDVQNYLRSQRSASDQESIYDSDVQYNKEKENPSPKQQSKHFNTQQRAQRPIKQQAPLKPLQQKPSYARPIQGEKPFICGCGRTYTVSSSLNLHIKKAHNWITPMGTIGGPRGLMGGQSQAQLIKKNKIFHEGQGSRICSLCSQPTGIQYIKCNSCLNHILCSQCFWGTNNFNKEHDWVVKKGI